jgi:hypothetical protein
MNSRSRDIIFLLGAGASAEAGIPTSSDMIIRIERLLDTDPKWKEFYALYNHVKSAIHYAAGLRGFFREQVTYNIETLVNTLYELERNEDHPLYPFIAAWNSRFVALARPDFSGVREFRRLILAALKKWMCPEDASQGGYYGGLASLQRDLNFPLHVFTLNYDLCVESLASADFAVETGFADFGPKHVWDWERFEEVDPNPLPQVMLYKLHGSINWKRDESTKQLFSVQQVENIDAEHMEVIFGRDFKLEAADPYLFYAYEFRRYTLVARLIVVIGYGFGDAHINKMLTQGMRADNDRRLLVVSDCGSRDERSKKREVAAKLELSEADADRILVRPIKARQFLQEASLASDLSAMMPKNPDAPF